MKKHWLILLTIICLLSGSCQQSTTYPPAMRQAESLMEIYPDSADCLLQDLMDSISSYSEETQRYYQLLRIQANDKLYITHRSDSLINLIVDFYEKLGDEEKLMKAYYYQGSVYRDMNDAPKALKSFQQAIDLNCPDYDLQARTYSQMGNLFAYQGLYEEAMDVHKKSMNIYNKTGANRKMPFVLRDIARMYDVQELVDSAMFYYKAACDYSLYLNDSVRYYNLLGEFGGFLFESGRIEKAKRLLKIAEQPNYLRDKSHIYLNLGNLYRKQQRNDSAYYYYHKALNISNIRKNYYSYKHLYFIEKENNNYAQAVGYIDKAIGLKEKIDSITQTEVVAKINALYNYQHTEKENLQLKQKEEMASNQLLFSFVVFVLIVIILLSIFIIQKKDQQQILAKEQILRKYIEDKYAVSESIIIENEQKISDLEKSLIVAEQEKDELRIKYLLVKKKRLKMQNAEILQIKEEEQLRINLFKQSSIYNEFMQASKNEHVNISPQKCPEKWHELAEALDNTYPRFTERILNVCLQLTETELHVCRLTKMGISPSNIAIILKYSKQNISNIRSKIYKKIVNGKSEFLNFDHFIESL